MQKTKHKHPRLVDVEFILPHTMKAGDAQERIEALGERFLKSKLSRSKKGIAVFSVRELR